MIEKNINHINRADCTGCGLCEYKCPQNAIEMVQEKTGFIYPNVNHALCVNCGICFNCCPTHSKNSVSPFSCYSFSLNNVIDLQQSSSGGAASSIVEYFINIDGVAYGVEYSDDFSSIRFNRYTKNDNTRKCKGSKYSETMPPDYQMIYNDIESGRPCVFIGLPCQVAAVRKLVNKNKKNNIVLVALACLGKSSHKLYELFIQELKERYNSNIVSINMRWKRKDWNTSWIQVKFENKKEYRRILSCDEFGLISHEFFRPSCYSCRFKLDNSPADIIIGDFWGSEYLDKDSINPMGVSAIVCLNREGDLCVQNVLGNKRKVKLSSITRTNGAISKSASKPATYENVISMINQEVALKMICKYVYGATKLIALNFKYFIKSKVPNNTIRAIKRVRNRKHSMWIDKK